MLRSPGSPETEEKEPAMAEGGAMPRWNEPLIR